MGLSLAAGKACFELPEVACFSPFEPYTHPPKRHVRVVLSRVAPLPTKHTATTQLARPCTYNQRGTEVCVSTYVNVHPYGSYCFRKMLYKVSNGHLNKPLHLAQLTADVLEEVGGTDGMQCWQTSQHMHSQWQLSLLDMKALLTLLAPMKASSRHSDLSS